MGTVPPDSPFPLACHRVRSVLFSRLVPLCRWLLVLLSFFEPPPWCEANGGCVERFSASGPTASAGGEIDKFYPSWNVVWVSAHKSGQIEAVLALFLLADLALRVGRDGSFRQYLFVFGNWQQQRFLQACSVIALALCAIFPLSFSWRVPAALLLRAAVTATHSDGAAREVAAMIRFLPRMASFLGLMLTFLVFWAWLGTVAFYNSGKEGLLHFSRLVESAWSLWTMITTANYPDVMLPAYDASRLTCAYFIFFMIITYYFLLNAILATIYNAYTEETEDREKETEERSEKNVLKAFDLLSGDAPYVGSDDLEAVFVMLNEESPEIPYIFPHEAKLMFALLDRDGNNRISRIEFLCFCDVMRVGFESSDKYKSYVECYYPNIYASSGYQCLCNAVNSTAFERIIDAVIVANAAVVYFQTKALLFGDGGRNSSVAESPHLDDGVIDTVWEYLETAFTVVYVVEMALKVLVLGKRRFLLSTQNTFDAIVVVAAVLATLVVYYPNRYGDSRLIRYIVLTRVIRVSRLLFRFRDFGILWDSFISCLPKVRRVALLLFFVFYYFSVFGMLLFGGLITRDPANPISLRLVGSAFEQNLYWANNFNDMMSGMVVMFELLVINNWPTTSDAITSVSGTKWSRWYFVVFFFIGNTIVGNLVTSSVIESFGEIYKSEKRKTMFSETNIGGDFGGDAAPSTSFSEGDILLDAALVTGTKTGLSGQYRATMHGKSIESKREIFIKMLGNKKPESDEAN